MESVSFSMTDVLTIVGGVALLVIHSSFFAHWLGKLSTQVVSNSDDVQGLADKSKLELKELKLGILEEVRRENKSRDEIWKITLDGILSTKEETDKRNFTEHNALFRINEKMDNKLDNLTECLHKMQNKKECD